MKAPTYTTLLTTLPLLLLLGACAKDSAGSTPETPTEEAAVPETVDVPTEAEAEAKAAEEITPANADAEFEKLMKEIQGDD